MHSKLVSLNFFLPNLSVKLYLWIPPLINLCIGFYNPWSNGNKIGSSLVYNHLHISSLGNPVGSPSSLFFKGTAPTRKWFRILTTRTAFAPPIVTFFSEIAFSSAFVNVPSPYFVYAAFGGGCFSDGGGGCYEIAVFYGVDSFFGGAVLDGGSCCEGAALGVGFCCCCGGALIERNLSSNLFTVSYFLPCIRRWCNSHNSLKSSLDSTTRPGWVNTGSV